MPGATKAYLKVLKSDIIQSNTLRPLICRTAPHIEICPLLIPTRIPYMGYHF